MTETSNPTIAQHATEIGVINLNKRTLIGIVGTAEKRRVLVRFPGGKIETLTLGDTLKPGKIIAISEDAVMIDTPTGAQKLTLPTRSAA
ncbi:hypothetical protein [Tateyamaria pelophila]|uniref:hypothetical protein n=1 Tax=Tateyamaria pelophila TaxID=328415 RepID=UPI001CBC2CB9|nr:hypothetical protein [Tateyamaria pelophila]